MLDVTAVKFCAGIWFRFAFMRQLTVQRTNECACNDTCHEAGRWKLEGFLAWFMLMSPNASHLCTRVSLPPSLFPFVVPSVKSHRLSYKSDITSAAYVECKNVSWNVGKHVVTRCFLPSPLVVEIFILNPCERTDAIKKNEWWLFVF